MLPAAVRHDRRPAVDSVALWFGFGTAEAPQPPDFETTSYTEMEAHMRVISALPLLIPTVLGLAACADQPPPTTQVVVQSPPASIVPSSPMPPPPPLSELVPPPPVSATPTVWQPGHWRYTGVAGGEWAWQHGQYVAVPAGASAWVPGQWQQLNTGWVWREGHWAA